MRRIEKVEAAIRAPVEPADTAACAQPSRTAPAVTTSDDSGLARTAASGSSSNAICSGAWRIVTPRGSFPPYSARISGVSPTRTISSWPGTTASSAPTQISDGARSPPMASSAIVTMRTRRPQTQVVAAWYARSRYVPQVGQTRWASFGDLQRSQVATAAALMPWL